MGKCLALEGRYLIELSLARKSIKGRTKLSAKCSRIGCDILWSDVAHIVRLIQNMPAIPGKGAVIKFWSRREDLNTPSADYNSAALTLSYTGKKRQPENRDRRGWRFGANRLVALGFQV